MKTVKYFLGGTLATTGGAGATYCVTKDGSSNYEVEDVVIKEDVDFRVTSDEMSNSVKIAVEDESDFWKTNDYSWDCTVTKPSILATRKIDFKIKLSEIFEQNYSNIKKRLVEVCSKKRTSQSSNNSVSGKFTFPVGITEVDGMMWVFIWRYGKFENIPKSEAQESLLQPILTA